MWTRFMDMHSGGRTKNKPYEYIYIEAATDEAKLIFYNRFGSNPERVSCTCCGDDYSISEGKTLAELTGYDRGCDFVYVHTKTGKELADAWVPGKGIKKGYVGKYVERASSKGYSFNGYVSLSAYRKRKDVLIIPKREIKPEERKGEVPTEGYVWV